MLMLQPAHRDTMRTYGTLLGRALMGLLFVFSGANMFLGGAANTATYFDSMGVPLAALMVWVVITIKVGAGSALILGYRVGLAASLLILFTLGTILVAHMNLSDMNLFKNLAIIGGLCYVIAYGPGEGWKL